jgi:holo-[acyl-carrier protein] synthase
LKIFCGTDIIETDRIKKAIEGTKGFTEKIYTKNEIEYCTNKKEGRFKSYAARFSAKEAVAKALGTGFTGKIRPIDIEILNDDFNKPYVKFHGAIKEQFEEKKIKKMDLSISHCEDYAVAYFVAVTEEDENE